MYPDEEPTDQKPVPVSRTWMLWMVGAILLCLVGVAVFPPLRFAFAYLFRVWLIGSRVVPDVIEVLIYLLGIPAIVMGVWWLLRRRWHEEDED